MYNMTNIRLEGSNNYWTVIADTERFGKDEVMFEGSYDECWDYMKREKFGEGNEKFKCVIKGFYDTGDYNGVVFDNDWVILHKNGFIEQDWSKFGLGKPEDYAEGAEHED